MSTKGNRRGEPETGEQPRRPRGRRNDPSGPRPGGDDTRTATRDRYIRNPEDLIPMLQTIQRGLGYLPEEALLEVARLARIPASTVFGVATFYEQFRLEPTGEHIVRLCRGTACHVRGANRILNEVRAAFGVEPGETTEDGSFTLETVACFGSCALAPVVVVDDAVKGRMTPAKARSTLEALRQPSEPLAESAPPAV